MIGTGYASYARLKNVDADILKIDGSFIRNIVSNSLRLSDCGSICHLARMENMQVVAEYVESEEIRSVVLSLGIDYLQGYLLASRSYYLRFSKDRRRGAASGSQFTRRSPASFLPHIETPASYRFPVLLFFFQIKQYQRILAEPVMRKT